MHGLVFVKTPWFLLTNELKYSAIDGNKKQQHCIQDKYRIPFASIQELQALLYRAEHIPYRNMDATHCLPWLVYRMTGSEFLLGLVSFAGQIPTFLLAPFAGVMTDKFNKYKVLLTTQVLSLVQASVLAFLSLTGVIQIWQIVMLSIILGCINAFDVPSRHSFVVEMVEKKEDLGNAIALNSMMFNGARLIGPSIAGLLSAATGEGICFLINAVSYIFVIGSLLKMQVINREAKKNR